MDTLFRFLYDKVIDLINWFIGHIYAIRILDIPLFWWIVGIFLVGVVITIVTSFAPRAPGDVSQLKRIGGNKNE